VGEYRDVINFLITSRVLSTLCLLGSGASCFMFCMNNPGSLLAGAPLHFTKSGMGWSDLCILIRPLIFGAVGFMFICRHIYDTL